MTLGFLLAGPLSGTLSDRFGSRPFAIGGLVLMALTFVALALIPVDFDYRVFAVLIFLNGLGGGIFTAPNTAAIMSSVPAAERGAASGIRATVTNGGMSLSIGIFFSLMIAGLAHSLPTTLSAGLQQQGVPATVAHNVANLPPAESLFAAFLGYNPIAELLGSSGVLQQPGVNAAVLTGNQFFPQLISGPFHNGLVVAASWINPGRTVDDSDD
jgi:MFS family permease